MPSNEEIKAAVAEASKLLKDPTPEVIQALAKVDAMIDEKDKSDKAFEGSYATLRENYRKAVLEAPLPPRNTIEETGTGEPKKVTFEEALKQAGDELAKGK